MGRSFLWECIRVHVLRAAVAASQSAHAGFGALGDGIRAATSNRVQTGRRLVKGIFTPRYRSRVSPGAEQLRSDRSDLTWLAGERPASAVDVLSALRRSEPLELVQIGGPVPSADDERREPLAIQDSTPPSLIPGKSGLPRRSHGNTLDRLVHCTSGNSIASLVRRLHGGPGRVRSGP